MATIGLDCDLILDGTGYRIEPASFVMIRPRVRAATHNRNIAIPGGGFGTGVGERYVDFGPAKREWRFLVPCFQAMRDYAGNPVASTGQQYRDALHTSYEKVNTTLSFTDPHGTAWTVHFDHLEETVVDVHAVGDGELQYYCSVELVEA